jgi:hypothetical protein
MLSGVIAPGSFRGDVDGGDDQEDSIGGSQTTAIGRSLPVVFPVIRRSERPLLSKADIQILILKNPQLNGRIAPGSGH